MSLSRNKQPLYVQIKNILKDRILHGLYPLGDNLPPEPRLEEEFGVSKITVRGAIKALVQEGYLETSSGKGTKVIRNTSTSKRSTWKRFTELLVEEGHKIQKRLLVTETVPIPEEDVMLRQRFGDHCLRITRLYLLNEEPYIHYTHYLPSDIDGGKHPDLDDQSLYGWMEDQGVTIANFRDEFTVDAPEEAVGKLLLAEPGASLLRRHRYAYNEDGNVVEYSVGFYRTGLHAYVVNYEV